MCGRYTLIRLNDVLERFPWIQRVPPAFAARYNIAPTQPVLVLANNHPDKLDHFVWGLVPSWAKDPSIGNRMINARSETLLDTAAYRKAAASRRCLVPADGWYEWQASPTATDAKGRPRKQPFFVHLADGG